MLVNLSKANTGGPYLAQPQRHPCVAQLEDVRLLLVLEGRRTDQYEAAHFNIPRAENATTTAQTRPVHEEVIFQCPDAEGVVVLLLGAREVGTFQPRQVARQFPIKGQRFPCGNNETVEWDRVWMPSHRVWMPSQCPQPGSDWCGHPSQCPQIRHGGGCLNKLVRVPAVALQSVACCSARYESHQVLSSGVRKYPLIFSMLRRTDASLHK